MRPINLVALVIGMAAVFGAAEIAHSQGGAVACRPNGGACLPTTAANYNRCVQLGLQRGLLLTRGDRYNLEAFVYSCVAGRVGRS